MPLPKDPYEVTTELLIREDEVEYEQLDIQIQDIKVRTQILAQRIEAYKSALEGYRSRRPVIMNGDDDPFVDEARLKDTLEGLTILQSSIFLGIRTDRRFMPTYTGRLMHRLGVIGGQWKNVPNRLYKIANDNPDVFRKAGPGEYTVLSDAEKLLPSPLNEELHDNIETVADLLGGEGA